MKKATDSQIKELICESVAINYLTSKSTMTFSDLGCD
ncbi:MAG: hypothetical protein RLZZ429_2335 [Bacteroidota bacterium]|jgi:hypothetical protein